MKKLYSIIVPVIALATSFAVVVPVRTYATTNSNNCSVESVGDKNTAGNADSRFVLNDNGTVSATFEVKGGNDCKVDVVLASWQAPDGDKGLPYSDQKLFKHVSGNFGKGKHTLTVELPKCYYQVDLARGKNPTGPNGSAVYEKERLMGSLHGGTQKCEEPKTPTTTTTTSTPTPAPVMPATGAGSILGIFAGASAFGAVAHRIAIKRRAN
jgi:hypothetical protein